MHKIKIDSPIVPSIFEQLSKDIGINKLVPNYRLPKDNKIHYQSSSGLWEDRGTISWASRIDESVIQ